MYAVIEKKLKKKKKYCKLCVPLIKKSKFHSTAIKKLHQLRFVNIRYAAFKKMASRTSFHNGFKFQTNSSSLQVSWKHALQYD